MSPFWSNKVVLITGASSGIGRGLAVALGRRGAKLGLLARRKELLESLVQEVTAAGGHAIALSANVQDEAELREAVTQLNAAFGDIDILIANAGIGGNNDGAALNLDEFSKVISVNVLGVINSVAAVVPQMVDRGRGQLVAI